MWKLKSGLHCLAALTGASFLVFGSNLPGAQLLPDIYMDIRDIAQGTNGSQQVLRFSTWTVNIGTGPLELHQHPAQNPDGTYDVDQWIYDDHVPPNHTATLVGKFAVVNSRLRFLDSADYFLREVTAGNGVGGIVAANQKVSYCIVDSAKYNPSGGGPGSSQYTTCGPTMGVSVNWADIYPSSFTSSQIVPLSGVSSGTYWLENTGDPLNRLIESNETNNTTRVLVTINTGLSPEIDVKGNGQSIPNNDVTPNTTDGTDFGPVDVLNDSLIRTFTIQNSGTGSLSLTGVPSVQITGSSDFTVVMQPISPVAASGGTTTFQLKFDPSSTGSRTATVIISNNDANESSYQFAIRGDGTPDSDNDGEDDISESASGTNPNDPNSVVRTGKQTNISTRVHCLTGDSVGIGGFIITGSDPKKIVVRAIGQSLSAFNIPNLLQDPTVELHDHTGATIAFNDDWQQDSSAAEVASNGLAPGDIHESAMLRLLAPGAYTAILRGNGSTIGNGDPTGVGLVEAYDVDPNVASTFTNISTRGFAETGDNVMIAGVIIGRGLGANGAGSVQVLVRGIGPTLAQYNVPNPLQDPTLELHDGQGTIITSNDNWRDTQETAIQATGMAPPDDRESAILVVLTKGNYTAILRGKDSSTGVALVEIYKVP